MKYLYIVISIFSLIALFDVIIGGKLGLGKEFEKGISLIGVMTLSMTGMLILAPCIAYLLSGITSLLPSFIDPSIIASSILANDMGGTTLSTELCLNEEIGYFNGLVVASMMGCTISFNIPFALGTVEKEHRSDVLYG